MNNANGRSHIGCCCTVELSVKSVCVCVFNEINPSVCKCDDLFCLCAVRSLSLAERAHVCSHDVPVYHAAMCLLYHSCKGRCCCVDVLI